MEAARTAPIGSRVMNRDWLDTDRFLAYSAATDELILQLRVDREEVALKDYLDTCARNATNVTKPAPGLCETLARASHPDAIVIVGDFNGKHEHWWHLDRTSPPGPVESQRGHFKPFSRVPGGRVGRYYLLRKLRGENFNCDYTVLYRPSVASTLFQACEEEFVYNTGDLARVQIFGKYRDIPRKQVAFGDPGLSYRFSGVEIPARPWSPLLRTIKDRIQEVTGQEFNFVLINR
ncbi:Alpha-ketoglutarate-dependent dioxygenase alkB 2 [Branchiostoma belcheri]|nr:Alpha-ketoglutarate-dependent dioxygenase alkB 2 [Branchiostoma belcheri]